MKKIISFLKHNLLLSMLIFIGLTSSYFLVNNLRSEILEVVFIDVGQGDAIFITTPRGRQILIDTGPKNNLGQKLSKYMSSSDRSLDLVIMTHPDLDHVASMVSLVDRYSIDMIMHSGLLTGAPIYWAIAEKINEKEIPTFAANAGQRITLDHHVYLDVYAPHALIGPVDPNDHSVVVRLVYKNNSVLLTGDASDIVEYELIDTYGESLRSDILKVGHHGSQTSTSEVFIETVDPKYAIISASCDNRFGHPHGSVLATLFKSQAEVLSTCDEGDIVFAGDGETWVKK